MEALAKDCLPQDWWDVARCVDEYEAARPSGPPDLRALAERASPSGAAAAIAELAAVDMEHQWESGQRKTVEEYLDEFPELRADHRHVAELIAQEFEVRCQNDRWPTIDEYRRRFPDYDVAGIIGELETTTRTFGSTNCLLPPAAAEPPPEKIGRYEVREEVGSGAFGRVYRCFDAELRRDVAVKLPHPNRRPESERRREFLHEARSAAQLRHPRIVSVLDVGELDDGRAFVVYEFVVGQTLRARIRRKQFTRAEAVGWCVEIAEALHFAHAQRVVHRDVSPDNVLLDAGGHVRLTDFGLSQLDGRFFRDDNGAILGSPAYISPEQACGESHWASPQSDIYSLGVILYELLTGERPFGVKGSGGLRDMLAQIERRAPAPPRTVDDTISRQLEAVCLKALEKDPAERFKTAADMAAALQATTRTRVAMSRRRLLAWGGSAVAAGLTGVLAWWLIDKSRVAADSGTEVAEVPLDPPNDPPPDDPPPEDLPPDDPPPATPWGSDDDPKVEFYLFQPDNRETGLIYHEDAPWAIAHDGDMFRMAGDLGEEGGYVSVWIDGADGRRQIFPHLPQQKLTGRFTIPQPQEARDGEDGPRDCWELDGRNGYGRQVVFFAVSDRPVTEAEIMNLPKAKPRTSLGDGPNPVPTPCSVRAFLAANRERVADDLSVVEAADIGRDLAEYLQAKDSPFRAWRAVDYRHMK